MDIIVSSKLKFVKVLYSPRGIKGLEGSLGLDTPIELMASTRTSYGTPSSIFLGSNVVSLQTSKLSLIHLELCFFFLSIKYPDKQSKSI